MSFKHATITVALAMDCLSYLFYQPVILALKKRLVNDEYRVGRHRGGTVWLIKQPSNKLTYDKRKLAMSTLITVTVIIIIKAITTVHVGKLQLEHNLMLPEEACDTVCRKKCPKAIENKTCFM